MPTIVVPSAVKVAVAWAKSRPDIVTALGGPRVSTSLPVKGLEFPWVTVGLITGIPQYAEIPMDHARLQWNVWGGRKANGLPDWDLADGPTKVIQGEVREFNGFSAADAVIKTMAPFEGTQQLEDPDTGDARFWFDTLCVVRSTNG